MDRAVRNRLPLLTAPHRDARKGRAGTRPFAFRASLVIMARVTRTPAPPSAAPPPPAAVERAIRTCPNCGRELAERKCKLFCETPGCGYYLSCADYY